MLAACVMCSCGSRDSKVEALPSVKVVEARVSGEGVTQQYPGKVVASADANVSFKVPGTLRRVNVKEGQHVAKGQLLAELDNTDYLVQLKATEAEHAQIKAEAERVIGLYGEGATTSSLYDKARYGLEQINAKLENHRNQLAYTRIYAPYEGVVQKIYMNEGETVGAGMPVVGMLSSAAPEIEINLPAGAYAHRQQFNSFTCTFDVLPGETMTAPEVCVLPQANGYACRAEHLCKFVYGLLRCVVVVAQMAQKNIFQLRRIMVAHESCGIVIVEMPGFVKNPAFQIFGV